MNEVRTFEWNPEASEEFAEWIHDQHQHGWELCGMPKWTDDGTFVMAFVSAEG